MTVEISGKQSGISAGMLKIIAVVTMLIDHVAAAVLVRYYYATWDVDILPIYTIMRQIGRTAFPIYCFMLVEGLERTRSRGKYLARMTGLALLSEIPFDLALSSQVLEFGYQNVFFTLAIALLTMIVLEWLRIKNIHPIFKIILTGLIAFGGMLLAYYMQTDYDWRGVACILLMYFFRRNPRIKLIVSYIAFVILLEEWAALPAFILLGFYHGRKGFSNKFFFYGFYPVHLLILYVVCMFMGIAMISAV